MRPKQRLKAVDLITKDVDFDTQEKRERILDCLRVFKASYPAEIAWETGYSDYEIKILLKIMLNEDVVERISVNINHPDPRLLCRVPEMSARGEGGYDAFSRKRWFGVR